MDDDIDANRADGRLTLGRYSSSSRPFERLRSPRKMMIVLMMA